MRSTLLTRALSSTSSAPNHLPFSSSQKQTIYALATPPGKAGVAIIRVSGPAVLDVYKTMVRRYDGKGKKRAENFGRVNMPQPRILERAHILDATTGEVLDDGMVVFFAGLHFGPTLHRS
jgi:tRNA modification GTPase